MKTPRPLSEMPSAESRWRWTVIGFVSFLAGVGLMVYEVVSGDSSVVVLSFAGGLAFGGVAVMDPTRARDFAHELRGALPFLEDPPEERDA